MNVLPKEALSMVSGGDNITDAALKRLELGYWGVLLGAGLSAKYIGEVTLFPWLTLPASLSVVAGAMFGGHIGAYIAQLHHNATIH